jgi:hypothetical protein
VHPTLTACFVSRQALHDAAMFDAGIIVHDAVAEFLVNDAVNDVAILGVRYAHLEAAASGQALTVERLLHREPGPQKTDHGMTCTPDFSGRWVSKVQECHPGGRFDRVGGFPFLV